MKIGYNQKSKKYEPLAELGEKISNLKVEDEISKFRIFDGKNFIEIHFFSQTGQVLSRNERLARLPKEEIVHFENENYYLKISHYIEEDFEHEKIKSELYDSQTNQFLGKSLFDIYPIFQQITINAEKEKEEILDAIFPYRYYERRGYNKLDFNQKISFWYYELQRMERMNSPYPLPYKNKGFNVLECWYINNIYAKFEDDLKSFLIALAKSFKIAEALAVMIYENRHDEKQWNELVKQYEQRLI